MEKTKITWTGATWNPIRGCERVTEACTNCYAEIMAARFSKPGLAFEGLGEFVTRPNGKREARWTGKVMEVERLLTLPLDWRTPTSVFVNSVSDLFHKGVTQRFRDRCFAVMALGDHHEYQILTKRPAEALDYIVGDGNQVLSETTEARVGREAMNIAAERGETVENAYWDAWWQWPLPNVRIGVSVHDQPSAEEFLTLLRKIPAAAHFVSLEPLLAPVFLKPWLDFLSWVIIGGESGPVSRVRDFDLAWPRGLIAQCREAGVPVFNKQLGRRPVGAWIAGSDMFPATPNEFWPLNDKKGEDMSEWPKDLRVREFPTRLAA